MNDEIRRIPLDESIDTCPVCGYADGFHVSFKVNNGIRTVILICPECHTRFDAMWERRRAPLPSMSE
ncbi:MAG: hypothetical protein SVY10_09445 [Thermodesulfobacteriota bacterium]|nr:hypothetical protein [Thermodesulfobacteriota bacterium]